MKIAIGSDHAGFIRKQEIMQYLDDMHLEYEDFGTYGQDSVDYPDFAKLVSHKVASHEFDFGILVCYTGVGMSISSNKVEGIRAALVQSVENAGLAREHNNANVLCLGAKDVNKDLAIQIVATFLNSQFQAGRHLKRVQKIMDIEAHERKK